MKRFLISNMKRILYLIVGSILGIQIVSTVFTEQIKRIERVIAKTKKSKNLFEYSAVLFRLQKCVTDPQKFCIYCFTNKNLSIGRVVLPPERILYL